MLCSHLLKLYIQFYPVLSQHSLSVTCLEVTRVGILVRRCSHDFHTLHSFEQLFLFS